MPANTVLVNGCIEYTIPDSKMKAVDEVLILANNGASGRDNFIRTCPEKTNAVGERRSCCMTTEVK